MRACDWNPEANRGRYPVDTNTHESEVYGILNGNTWFLCLRCSCLPRFMWLIRTSPWPNSDEEQQLYARYGIVMPVQTVVVPGVGRFYKTEEGWFGPSGKISQEEYISMTTV